MNRQIKFRGKRIDNGEWVYGDYFKTPLTDENSGTQPESGWFYLTGQERHNIRKEHGVSFVVDPKTVGQFTGLYDREGKEIFEGDRVRVKWLAELGITEINCEATGVVKWSEDICGFQVELTPAYKCGLGEDMAYEETHLPLVKQTEETGELTISYEVIGNIHDQNQ